MSIYVKSGKNIDQVINMLGSKIKEIENTKKLRKDEPYIKKAHECLELLKECREEGMEIEDTVLTFAKVTTSDLHNRYRHLFK